MGSNFTLAIDKSNALWAWGGNASGQLGNGTTASSSAPVRVATLPVGAVVQAVAAGQNFGLALVTVGTDAGRIYAWGDNSLGELGLGTNQSAGVPAQVPTGTRRFVKIAATSETALAIATDGTLWAWGLNGDGECGQGSLTNFSFASPVQIGAATTWTAVTGGTIHVLALQGTKLFAWGSNGFGQVGNNTFASPVLAPVPIATAQTWASIGAGEFHSLAINSAGTLFGWGENQFGQIDLPVTQTSQNEFRHAADDRGSLAPWSIAKGGQRIHGRPHRLRQRARGRRRLGGRAGQRASHRGREHQFHAGVRRGAGEWRHPGGAGPGRAGHHPGGGYGGRAGVGDSGKHGLDQPDRLLCRQRLSFRRWRARWQFRPAGFRDGKRPARPAGFGDGHFLGPEPGDSRGGGGQL